MKITVNNNQVTIRRDLTPSELLQAFNITPRKELDIQVAEKRLGDHSLRFSGRSWKPSELRQEFYQEAEKVCSDYTVHHPGHSSKKRFSRNASTAKMAIVIPEKDWTWKNVISFMKENGLRPTSFYEHISFVGEHPELFENKTAVPFGGYNGHLGTLRGDQSCPGLGIITNGTFEHQEGSAGLKKVSVAFTATHIS